MNIKKDIDSFSISNEAIARAYASQVQKNLQEQAIMSDNPEDYKQFPDMQSIQEEREKILSKHPVRLFSYSQDVRDDYMKSYDKTVEDPEWFEEYLMDLIQYPDFRAVMRNIVLMSSYDEGSMFRVTERARRDYAGKMQEFVKEDLEDES